MSRIIAMGDTHGRAFWKLVSNTEKWDKFIFIGDYFDSFDIDSETQQRNFKEICLFKEKYKEKVVLLIGNHDISYMLGAICSGYQYGAEHNIKHLLSTYKDLLQMAHSEEDVLFTHAGVGEMWLGKYDEDIEVDHPFTAEGIAAVVNDLWKYKPNSFIFDGLDDYGDDVGQTPVWIRPRSLAIDSRDMKKAGIVQVIGHTGAKKLDIEGGEKHGYFLIDTLGSTGEYLIIENGEFKTGKV